MVTNSCLNSKIHFVISMFWYVFLVDIGKKHYLCSEIGNMRVILIINIFLCAILQGMGCFWDNAWQKSRNGQELCNDSSIQVDKMEEYKYHYKYPHPGVTTDNVIFGFDGKVVKVLLIERKFDPYKGCWAFPGGFLEMTESAEEGARRELMEETGLDTTFVKQFHTFSTPDRDPRERVITIAYYSLVRMSEVKGMDDAAQAKWFSLDEVPKLAFDHEEMLRIAKEEISKEMRLNTKDWQEMTKGFTKEEVEKIKEWIEKK